MRRVAFINEKGGTGKTTLAVNIAAWLAGQGKRVLLVDADTQGHAGKSLGVDVRGLSPTVAELMLDPRVPLSQVVRPTAIPNLSLIPANKAMADFPERAAALPRRESLLRDRLTGLHGFDWVVFDAPPSLGLVTKNVLLATEEVVIPVALTYLALDGAAELVESVERLRDEHDHASLRVSLVVPTFHRRTGLADAIHEKLQEHFGDRLARTVLGFSVAIDEAQSFGKTVFEHAPGSKGAEMLEALARELDALTSKRRRAS